MEGTQHCPYFLIKESCVSCKHQLSHDSQNGVGHAVFREVLHFSFFVAVVLVSSANS